MRFTVIVKKDIFKELENIHIETGIIKDDIHYEASQGTTTLGGIIVRKTNRGKSNSTLVKIAKKMEGLFGFMSKPKNPRKDVILQDLAQYLLDYLSTKNKSYENKVINGATSIIRQPMYDGSYKNSTKTVEIKGFNRGTIDTGQLYKNIKSIIVKDK